jgi:phosphinothricin acetyltransferase
MQIRNAHEADVAAIAAILNHEIANSPAIWLEAQVTPSDREKWLAERQTLGFPVLVAESEGAVLGFGSYGSFRPYYGFRNTVEHLIYVSPVARGHGVGRALLVALIEQARQRGMKVIVGAVDSENEPSLRLHHALGFIETGRMTRIGEKWEQRRDMVLLQKELAL